MGGAMARRLLARGFAVTVFDVNTQAMRELEALGAVAGAGPREVVQRCDLILCSLPSAHVSVAVARDVAGAGKLRAQVYLETSTIGQGAIMEIAAA